MYAEVRGKTVKEAHDMLYGEMSEVLEMCSKAKEVNIFGGCTEAMLRFSDAITQGIPTVYQLRNLRQTADSGCVTEFHVDSLTNLIHSRDYSGCANMKKPA